MTVIDADGHDGICSSLTRGAVHGDDTALEISLFFVLKITFSFSHDQTILFFSRCYLKAML